MEGLIQQAQETRKKAEKARTDAIRLRRESAALIERAQAVRVQWIALFEKSVVREPRTTRLPRVNLYVVLVNAIQVDGQELTRGDVITNELTRLNFQALAEPKLIRRGDYQLSDLNSPGDPWWDGRWMG